MKLNSLVFYAKKLVKDFTDPLIYDICIEKNSVLGSYYFKFDEVKLLQGGSQNFHFDNDGIPVIPTYIDIEESEMHYYPIAIGQYALAIFHTYLSSKEEKDKKRFLTLADWFVDNQTDDGYWLANVEEKKYKLKAGWVSSMAQGRVISVLLRASQIEKDKKYEKSAMKALDTFSNNSKFRNMYNENIFYEEYPSIPGSFVLNGMIFALFGLYDFIRYSNNRDAQKYFNDGVASLKNMLHLYDLGYWSSYDLRQYTWGEKYLNPCTVHYQYIHVNQLKVLFGLTEKIIFKEYAKKWENNDKLFNKIKMYIKKYITIKNRQNYIK